MPGGKERALRRRIRSVQSTKKITKAMELIAASRIVKAQQRVAAARPYSERITEVIRNLAAAGAGGGSPLLAERDEVAHGRLRGRSPPTGACRGAYNSSVIRAAERSMQRQRAEGRQTRLDHGRQEGRSRTSASGAGTSTSPLRGLRPTQPAYEDARPIAELRRHPASRRASTTWSSWPTRSSCRPASQRVVIRRFVPLDPSMLEQAGRRAARPTTSSSPTPRRSSTGCCPATPRPGCTRRCSTGRRRSSPPSSGP